MGGEGGLVEGNPLPSAFALFLIQVLLIICVARILGAIIRPVSWYNTPGNCGAVCHAS
jgi:hypothetical protein